MRHVHFLIAARSSEEDRIALQYKLFGESSKHAAINVRHRPTSMNHGYNNSMGLAASLPFRRIALIIIQYG